MLSMTLECEMLCNICTYPSFLPSFPFCQMHNKTLSFSRSQTAKAGILSSTNLWNECWYQHQSFSFVNLHPQGEEKRAASPGDWPETQLASRPDCISIEQTTSYQWRERSGRKGKWKLMNRSQVTVARRQFTTDVFRKIQEGKDRLSKCSEEAPSFWFKRGKKKPRVSQYLPFQFMKREIGLHRPVVNLNVPPLFFNWVIKTAVVFVNEMRAEPPPQLSMPTCSVGALSVLIKTGQVNEWHWSITCFRPLLKSLMDHNAALT